MILLFDAANTIIHKPKFFEIFKNILSEFDYDVTFDDLQKHHKLVSECFTFPDRTSQFFYSEFNSEVLCSLGIQPTKILLDKIFDSCSYLPWERFEDVVFLEKLPYKKMIVSNFHNGLNKILEELYPDYFDEIYSSENEGLRKPDIQFYLNVINKIGVKPSEIIYIGDSLKLDLIPGQKAGMNSWLIDRNNNHPYCDKRIQSFKELQYIL